MGQWTFERLSFRGRELELSEPLTVRIERNGNQWRAENRELGICVFASSIGRLLERVAEAFFALWDRYIPVDDEVMEKDAAIRDAFLRMVTGQQKTF